MAKKKLGRPPKPDSEKTQRDPIRNIRMSSELHALAQRAASLQHAQTGDQQYRTWAGLARHLLREHIREHADELGVSPGDVPTR